jgi:hypothetical protein
MGCNSRKTNVKVRKETPMELNRDQNYTQGLTRTGRRSGCSCCSFTLMGFLAIPVLAVISILLVV